MADFGIGFDRPNGGGGGVREVDAFAEELRRFAATVRGRVDLVVQGVAEETARRLAARMHVITGRLVGNWHVSLNVEDFSYDEAIRDAGRTEALARNLRTIALAQAGDRLFIQNNTPYLIYEEFGTRYRAPHPMVRSVTSEMPAIFAQVVARVRSEQVPTSILGRVRALFGY